MLEQAVGTDAICWRADNQLVVVETETVDGLGWGSVEKRHKMLVEILIKHLKS